MESLLYHSLLGVTRFIFYTSSLPHSVQQVAVNLQMKSQVQVLNILLGEFDLFCPKLIVQYFLCVFDIIMINCYFTSVLLVS